MSKPLTTGDVAKLLRCSIQCVIRAYERGELRGWKLPGSKFRRFDRDVVLAYARERNIPVEETQEATP